MFDGRVALCVNPLLSCGDPSVPPPPLLFNIILSPSSVLPLAVFVHRFRGNRGPHPARCGTHVRIHSVCLWASLGFLRVPIMMAAAAARSEVRMQHGDEFLQPSLPCFIWDLAEVGGYGSVQMKCLTCFFVLCYRSISHFSQEISLLFQTQFFPNSVCQQQPLPPPSRSAASN